MPLTCLILATWSTHYKCVLLRGAACHVSRDTACVLPPPQRNVDDSYQKQYFSGRAPQFAVNLPGFVPLQLLVDRFIINSRAPPGTLIPQLTYAAVHTGKCLPTKISNTSLDLFSAFAGWLYAPQFVAVSPFPQSAFTHNNFYDFAKSDMAMFFVLSFLFTASRLIRGLVLEKETRVRAAADNACSSLRLCVQCPAFVSLCSRCCYCWHWLSWPSVFVSTYGSVKCVRGLFEFHPYWWVVIATVMSFGALAVLCECPSKWAPGSAS